MPVAKKTTTAKPKAESARQSAESARKIQIPTQLLDFQKRLLKGQQTFFDTAYNAVTAVQENQEKAWGGALENASFIPTPALKIAEVWSDNRRRARESYKETVDRSFALAEQWIDGLSESRA